MDYLLDYLVEIMFAENGLVAGLFFIALLFGTPIAAIAFIIQLWSMTFHRGKILKGTIFTNTTILWFKFSRTFHIVYQQPLFAGLEKFRRRKVMVLKELRPLFDHNKSWRKGQAAQPADDITGDFLVYGRTLIACKSESLQPDKIMNIKPLPHDEDIDDKLLLRYEALRNELQQRYEAMGNVYYDDTAFAGLCIWFDSWPSFCVVVASLGSLAAYYSRIDGIYMAECWLAATMVSFIFWRSLGRVNLALAYRRIEPLLKQLSQKINDIPDYAVKNEDSGIYTSMISLGISALILLKADYIVRLLGRTAPGFGF
jgi:hypothetical protein